VRARAVGVLLFLPVPIVLALFTRLPLGVVPSVVIGCALMATHRLYARPFARHHADQRCLWCGADVANAARLSVEEPFGTTTWRACAEDHADGVRRVLGWAHRYRRFIEIGILGGLALFLPAVLAAGFHRLGPLQPEDAVAFFRLVVAASVLPLGWGAARSLPSTAEPLPSPFPVHIQALIGTRWVIWLFRWVGLVWLALSALHVWLRIR
jgi:hypothetical protein